MKELSLENELEVFYEYITSIEHLLINFSNYIKRRKTIKKIIEKNELLNNFVLKYINKNVPTKLSLHMKCVKNKKFYEYLFLCSFYHIIINYIIYDPLFNLQRKLEYKNEENNTMNNIKNENDRNFEKYQSDNKKTRVEKESNAKNETYLINMKNNNESDLSYNMHIVFDILKRKEKEEFSSKIFDMIEKQNIKFQKLNDEYFILSSTYEQICDIIFSFGILCYIYGFYKFFKIESVKIRKNKNCTYNLFSWIYDIKFNVLQSVKLNSINENSNLKENESDKIYVCEKFFQEFTREIKNINKDEKESSNTNVNCKNTSNNNINNNNNNNYSNNKTYKENFYCKMNDSRKNHVSSINNSYKNNLNNINDLNYMNYSSNPCNNNYLNKEIIIDTNSNMSNTYKEKNKINNSYEDMKHFYCSKNLNFSPKEKKKKEFCHEEKDEKDKYKNKNLHINNEKYDNYLNTYNISKNDSLVKGGNMYIDFEFYSYMILKRKEIEEIFLSYEEQENPSMKSYINTFNDNIIDNKENNIRNEKEIYNINSSYEYKENISVTYNEKKFKNVNVECTDDLQPCIISSYNYVDANKKKGEKKKYEYIKMHLENLHEKMKNIRTSRVYIWIYLYVNYVFEFLFNNSKKNYKKINNFNLCFDEGQYENNIDNINCNTSNNYCNNITRNNENSIKKKKIILFNLSGLIEFINKKSNLEKKHVTANLKSYIDNELFKAIKEIDPEDFMIDERKNKSDIEHDEYHKIRFYENIEQEKVCYEDGNNVNRNKHTDEILIFDNNINYTEVKVDDHIHNNKSIEKLDNTDDFFVKKSKYNFVNIKINIFVNDYIYMFVSYIILNAIKLSILLIEKYNLTIPNKYMDLSCYIYICQKNKSNSNILFFINKYNIHRYVFSNDLANKDIKENYCIYKNIECHNINNKYNDVSFIFMEDIISFKHIKENSDYKTYYDGYSNNYKIKNNFNMVNHYLEEDNKTSNEIKYNNNDYYRFSNYYLNNFNNYYLYNDKFDNWYTNSKNKNNGYSFDKKEYFDFINNGYLPDHIKSNYFKNCSSNNRYSKYKYVDNNLMHFENIKKKNMNSINFFKHTSEERKEKTTFSNPEEIKRNHKYNSFSIGNFIEKNVHNVKYLYENLDNNEYERDHSDNIKNKNYIDVYDKCETSYGVNITDKKEDINYNTNKYNNIEKKTKKSLHSFYYNSKDNIESNDINNIVNNNFISAKNNKEIYFDINNMNHINFLNYYIYPLKLNVVYDLYLNDILMNETKTSNIIDYCKGDRTLELELIKQKIMNGNIKYAIKLIKIFNYELLLFPNLFFYLNFKSYNYLLNTFDKKYIIYYLYDNPKYLKIYLNSLIKKKNFEYCLMALYFLYPSYISSEDSDFRTFCHLYLKSKNFKKINCNIYNDGFQAANENEFRETNKNYSINNENNNLFIYNICSFIKNECFILDDIYFTFKSELEFDDLRKVYKLSDLCKYLDIFINFKKINLDIIKNSFHYLVEMNGTCSCKKQYICIKDLGSSLKEVVIIETYNDFLDLYENIRKNEKVIFIDAEWKCAIFRENPIISIFQIALKNNCLSYIIDVKKISTENYEVNYYISELFRDESIIKIGVAFLNNDILHFRKYYDILIMLMHEKYKNILIEEDTLDKEENQYNNLFKHKMKINNANNCDEFLKKIMENIYDYGSNNYFNDNKNYNFNKNNIHSTDKKKRSQIDKNFNLNEDISFKNIYPVNYFLKNKKNIALIKKLLTTKCSSCNKIGIYSCMHKYYNLEFICTKYYDDLKSYFPFLKKNMNYSLKIIGKSMFPEKEVNKECQIINWNFRPLSSVSVEYAILDVLILKNFFNLIQTKLSFNIENAL
ncbi:conserved Plasmodium protein, unknown function [Plasmodium gallinaceum]|uniref:3'-5' exonuclease domain-containing protein n=1 Tax=Plasmodium gallinaceum TaxID=5849 RepID=A0A1J1GLG9_PLAGA|nr:conserved Plasmodium protein, unknown function [Plasmodium gallinaceum]CRG93264.1 conserved Plasmodium protein, unknown function [Plasmodium gallinaceum]